MLVPPELLKTPGLVSLVARPAPSLDGQYFMAHAHRHVPDNWLSAVRFLIEKCGADVNARAGNGYTPLHHAASRGDNKLIEYLLEKGVDVKVLSRTVQTVGFHDHGTPVSQKHSPPGFPSRVMLFSLR